MGKKRPEEIHKVIVGCTTVKEFRLIREIYIVLVLRRTISKDFLHSVTMDMVMKASVLYDMESLEAEK